MRGRAFLDLAREIIRGGTEKHWRGASGRAYYALMLECRDALIRWGFSPAHGESSHRFVHIRLSIPSDADVRIIIDRFDRLAPLRNKADYDLKTLPEFSSERRAQGALQQAGDVLDLLDALEADQPRLATVVSAISAAFP
jgi:hypothetical protein